jgi:hypothetical protein
MATINKSLSRWWRTALVLFVLALPLAGLRARASQMPSVIANPVWGRKPVLHYFIFTGDLARQLQSETGLSDAEFDIVRGVAQAEADRLDAIDAASRKILQNDQLKVAEKRQQIAASGYNQQVESTMQDTHRALENALGEQTYARLVAWIEERWVEEQSLHGLNAEPDATHASRTYSVYATRYDSGGAYTVALPDKCLKLANGGNHLCDDSGYSTGASYSVRLNYQDAVTVKVGESGPWNVDDNFWSGLKDPQPRRFFPDLPAGMPEAQAAYFDDYNNGLDQFDRIVTAPFGIDLARDVSIDIGLQPGVNDWIDVTFLWTDGWDGLQVDVVTLFDPTSLVPTYTGDMCVTAWNRITGYGDYAYLTLNVDSAAQSTNSGEWKPNLPVAGRYEVLAFVPDHPAIQWQCPSQLVERDSADARYTITYDGGQKTVSRDQGPLSNMWVSLGTYDFRSGTSGRVNLSDLNGENNLSHTVAFSGMQFRRIMPATAVPSPTSSPTPTSTPTPTATPTPTPTPAPQGYTGTGLVEPGDNITVPLGMRFIQPPGLGGVVLNMQFDPAVVQPLTCSVDPLALFDSAQCTLDAVYTDTWRLSLNSTGGVVGDPLLALVSFNALGLPGAYSPLTFSAVDFFDPTGMPLNIPFYDGGICIQPCRNITYMPIIAR